MSKLTYIRCGDYDIPNLKLSEQPETSIGKYGRMRKSYLKEHRPILYNQLLMSEKLYPHLLEIDWTAQERVDTMLPHMMEAAGVTEELKACDPMRWVGLMNTLTAQIEEILIRELICSHDDSERDLVDGNSGICGPISASANFAIRSHDAADCTLDQSLIDSLIGGRAGRQGGGSSYNAQTSQEYSAGKHLRHSSYLRAGGTRPVLTR